MKTKEQYRRENNMRYKQEYDQFDDPIDKRLKDANNFLMDWGWLVAPIKSGVFLYLLILVLRFVFVGLTP